MIERLMNPERCYGEPQYSKVSEQISILYGKLGSKLDGEGQAWLEQLADAYIRQGNTMLPDAFVDGFWTAVEVMREVERWGGREERERKRS